MKRNLALTALIAAILLVLVLPACAAAETGTCGENLTWTLDDDGLLTISGTGEMTSAPWRTAENAGAEKILSVRIEEGVTTICKDAFCDCGHLLSVAIAESVKTIGQGAFTFCNKLTEVTIPKGVTEIEGGTFWECNGIKNILVAEGNTVYASTDGVLFTKDLTTLLVCPAGKTGAYTIPDGVTTITGGSEKGTLVLVRPGWRNGHWLERDRRYLGNVCR